MESDASIEDRELESSNISTIEGINGRNGWKN